MSDLINREDAIKAVVNTPSNIADVMGNNLCLDGAVFRQNEIIDILNGIPSAEPTVDKDYLVRLIQEAVYDGEACKRRIEMVEPKQGEWICEMTKSHDQARDRWVIERVVLYCSECNGEAGKMTKFCPNCGARMKGADDE